MIKTQEQINEFFITARNYINENGDKDGQAKNDENKDLFYALRRMMVRLQKTQRKYNDKIQDLEEKHAAVDEKEMLVTDGRSANGQVFYRYKRSDKLKLNEEIRHLFQTYQSEFDPYYATSLPKNLDDDIREAFTDFVLEPDKKQEEPTKE